MSTKQQRKRTPFTAVALDEEAKRDMRALAHSHTRTLSGECVVAIREYIAKNKAE